MISKLQSRRGATAVTLVFACALWAVYRGGRVHRVRRLALAVPARDLRLGILPAAEAVHSTLHVKNATDREVDIVRFEASCACTSVSPESLTIAPDATAVVTLAMDTTRAHGAPGRNSRSLCQFRPCSATA